MDAGGRLLVTGRTYTASIEGVIRLPLDEPDLENLYRVVGILEYRLQDNLWLTGTFGRDYESERSGSLLAQVGLKFHITDNRYAPPIRSTPDI